MKLSPSDVELFMHLTVQLHWYAQQQGKVLSKINTLADYTDASLREKAAVRDYLFDHIELIASFIQANPAKLSSDELAIVSSWKTFVRGNFIIERLLKKHAIFIDTSERVYGVVGLQQEFSDIIDKRSLPTYVNALLLPFKGQIVYDGLLGFANLSFGSGMRSGFKETYLIAKDNDAIIEILDEDAIASTPKPSKSKAKPSKDWTPLLDDLSTTAKTLRGGSGQPALYSPAFSLVRASIELAQMATAEPPDIDKLLKKRDRLDALLNQLENAALRHH